MMVTKINLPVVSSEILLVFKVHNINVNGSLSATTLLSYFKNNIKGINAGIAWLIAHGFLTKNPKQIEFYHLTERGFQSLQA